MKVITVIPILAIIFGATTSFKKITPSESDKYVILVEKSDMYMTVFDGEQIVGEYPIVLGSDDLGDKMYAGDRRTPEGTFHVVNKRTHAKWDKFMLLDYPTKESYERFNERKAKGLIPKNAKIGGDIGIHGTWPNDDFMVDRTKNWTLGCVSLKNKDVDELYSYIAPGTIVVIRK